MKEFIIFLLLLMAIIGGHSYNLISFDLATFFVFVLVIGLLIYRDRKKVKFDKIVFIRRTKKGRNFIDKAANRFSGFWHIFGITGVVIAVFLLLIGSFFLINQAYNILGGAEGGVRLLLPGPVSAPTSVPGAFVVPWWIWVIGVAAVIIPHEFMHGIMCRLDKIRIKSVGWILLIVIPGAFVEPDEKQLKKARRSTKMKVYAAGSFANFIAAMIVLVVMAVSFSAYFSPAGVYVAALNGTPANLSGLSGSITEINGIPVKGGEDIRNILGNHKPGDIVSIKTVGGNMFTPAFELNKIDFFAPKPVVVLNTSDVKTYSITLGATETGRAFLGVQSLVPAASFRGDDIQTYQIITTLLLWIYIFNLGIGIVNILPIKPLDGGLLFEELIGSTKRSQFVVRAVSSAMLLILLFNLVGPIFLG